MRPAADVVGQPLSGDDGLVRAYRERRPRSAAAFEAARRVLPGGETRAVTSYPPYPVIITEGHGARLTDADGHVYLDLVNNYTAMVHGSAFAPAGILPDAGQIGMAVEEFRCGRGETHFAVRETWSVGLLVMRPLRQQRSERED